MLDDNMGVIPSETEVEFLKDDNGLWYIAKAKVSGKTTSRFRSAYKTGKITMSTDNIMVLTRGG